MDGRKPVPVIAVHYEENGEMKEIDYRFEEITVDGESLWVSILTLTRTPLITYQYNETYNVNTGVTYANGLTIEYVYDIMGNVESVKRNGETALDTITYASANEDWGDHKIIRHYVK